MNNELLNLYQSLMDSKAKIEKDIKKVKAEILANHENLPIGTTHGEGYTISIAKKVTWDQKTLGVLADRYNFIDVKYSVGEALFKNLPDDIKKDIEPARTVSEGTVTIKVKEVE